MIPHAEYMEKLIDLISSFHLIKLSTIFPVPMVLCTESEIYKLSMKHNIKKKHLIRLVFPSYFKKPN